MLTAVMTDLYRSAVREKKKRMVEEMPLRSYLRRDAGLIDCNSKETEYYVNDLLQRLTQAMFWVIPDPYFGIVRYNRLPNGLAMVAMTVERR